MTRKIEDYIPPIKSDNFYTEKEVNTESVVTSRFVAATTAGGLLAYSMGADGIGIYWGSGLPTASAPKGSIYTRTDGSSTSTRLYVNTDGGTTWTNVTTAA
jgi:hypothetical protein